MTATDFFIYYFERLRQKPPYPWQRKLFGQMVAREWPQVVDMPTGAGKTAVLWIWWLALAWSKQQGTNGIPIRLAWVVNRRVVVDQVSSEVNDLCEEWAKLRFEALPCPPAASTLRGQFADNGAWRNDPTVPAVIVGTVDMIGSRLLFRGYRSGSYWRPVEAGLLGVDTLIVNDEAHLSPAFAGLVGTLHEMRPADKIPGKSFRYMLLSATQSGDRGGTRFQHDPEEDGKESRRFSEVWTAAKTLELRQLANGPAVNKEIWKLATEEPAPRTIVFIDKPEEALDFYKRLTKDGFEAALMTGTMRGKERDELADSNTTFRRFQATDSGEGPVFLVATSAAEVGVNLTCERMITELCPADHLIQRFGRLNRFGVDGRQRPVDGKAFVVYVEPKKDSQIRLKATINYLRTLNGNINPRALWNCRPPGDAISELPKLARLETWRVESWAQTSYRDRFLPAVDSWIRGKEDDRPQTEVAWRADLQYLLEWGISEKQVERVLETFPVLAKEKLQEPSDRVLIKLQEIGGKLDQASDWILIVQLDQSVRWQQISKLESEEDIQYCLVLLPEHIGRVGQHGMFEPEIGDHRQKDISTHGDRIRILITEGEARYLGEPINVPVPSDTTAVRQFSKDHEFRAPVMIRNPENSEEMLVYLTRRDKRGSNTLREVGLKEHREAVAKRARQLAMAAGLGDKFAQLYHTSGLQHDEGKDVPVWQIAMGAKKRPAAKTVAAVNIGLLNGYRHEFGSLVQANGADDDLVLHLVATHHKSGRPFFESDAFGPLPEAACQQVAREAEQRFARLQHEFGPWGLAYLEAIFKRADGLVSADEGDGASE